MARSPNVTALDEHSRSPRLAGGAAPHGFSRAEPGEPGTLVLGVPAARPRRRHWLAILSFLLLVAVPTAGAAVYLWAFAADRYASRVAFSIRSGETSSPVELLGGLANLGGASAVTDGQALYDYIRSQEIVEEVRAQVPLEDYWNRAPQDILFALGAGQPVEDLVEYWNRMVDVAFDPSTGIISVEVRAFTPSDAHTIAAAILAASTRLVDRLSEEARADALRLAGEELRNAEGRLREIRARLRRFRDAEQEVNPAENASAALGLVAALEEELADARVELTALRVALDDSAPRVTALKRRIKALETRIAAERKRLGSGNGDTQRQARAGDGRRPLSRVVGEFEELNVDREFAEQAYTLALASYQQAEAEARRRNRYLVPHIRPTLAESAAYPDRPVLFAGVFLLACALWGILFLGAWNLRDRG